MCVTWFFFPFSAFKIFSVNCSEIDFQATNLLKVVRKMPSLFVSVNLLFHRSQSLTRVLILTPKKQRGHLSPKTKWQCSNEGIRLVFSIQHLLPSYQIMNEHELHIVRTGESAFLVFMHQAISKGLWNHGLSHSRPPICESPRVKRQRAAYLQVNI